MELADHSIIGKDGVREDHVVESDNTLTVCGNDHTTMDDIIDVIDDGNYGINWRSVDEGELIGIEIDPSE